MKRKYIIIFVVVTIGVVILTIFNIRSIINVGINNSGVADTVPVVIREDHLDALIELVKDSDIYDEYAVFERTDDEEIVSKYPRVKYENICVLDGDSEQFKNKILKMEAFLYLAWDEFDNLDDTISKETIKYYVNVVNYNKIKVIYNDMDQYSDKEIKEYANKFVIREYNSVGYDLTLYKVRYILVRVLFEVIYLVFFFIALVKMIRVLKKN